MPRLAADQNFNDLILRGLVRRRADLDIARLRDVGLARADDAAVLTWAANEARILLTHDVATMPAHVYDRLTRGEHSAGVIEVRRDAPIGVAIEDILLILSCMSEEEIMSQVLYVPL